MPTLLLNDGQYSITETHETIAGEKDLLSIAVGDGKEEVELLLDEISAESLAILLTFYVNELKKKNERKRVREEEGIKRRKTARKGNDKSKKIRKKRSKKA